MGSERRRRRARGVGHRGMSAAASNLRRGLFKLVGRSRRLREQRFLESRIVTLADHRLGGPRPLTGAVQTWTTRFPSRSPGGSPWPRSRGLGGPATALAVVRHDPCGFRNGPGPSQTYQSRGGCASIAQKGLQGPVGLPANKFIRNPYKLIMESV